MRSRLPLLTILLAGFSIALPHLAHAAIPFYGPIIPAGWNTCPSNWAGLITVANNVISFLITITITFVAPLAFAYGGFLYLTSGSSPGNRSQANSLMLNTVVGICIALASWLIVDAVLAVLYNPAAVGASWYSLVTANGSTCINVAGSLSISNGATVTGIDSNGGQILSYGSGPCDAATLLSATNNTLTSSQASTFACIAKYEDSCQAAPSPPNPCWNKDCGTGNGKASTAGGAFQVLMASNSSCYDNSVCEAAAGVSGPLNCKSAFTANGYIADQSKAQACLNAANDLQCSITAAQCLMNQNGGSFSAWTADSHSSGQAQCIANGGG